MVWRKHYSAKSKFWATGIARQIREGMVTEYKTPMRAKVVKKGEDYIVMVTPKKRKKK